MGLTRSLGHQFKVFALSMLVLPSQAATQHPSPTADAAPFRLWAWHAVDYPAFVGWDLTVDAKGILEVKHWPATRVVLLSPRQLAELIEAVERERFLELEPSYGTFRSNEPFRELDVWLHGKYKRVMIGGDLAAETRRDELRRALRVWAAVRGLFTDEAAIDTREEDKALLLPK
jgi:hypothetical protein